MYTVIRVTRTEFELDSGKIFPIIPPLDKDMTVEEFQKHYDFASQFIKSGKDVRCDDANTEELG